jgi:hypothetical protein
VFMTKDLLASFGKTSDSAKRNHADYHSADLQQGAE